MSKSDSSEGTPEVAGATIYKYYRRSVAHLLVIDPYRLQELYGIPEGPIFHAFKKLICIGGRGAKSEDQDVQEAIDSLMRWQEMREEDKQGELIESGKVLGAFNETALQMGASEGGGLPWTGILESSKC